MSAGAPEILLLLSLEVRSGQDVVLCRQRARQLAAALGFETPAQTSIATSLSEVARNAFEYAGGGRVEFTLQTDAPSAAGPGGVPRPQIFRISVRDSGPGIGDVGAALEGRLQQAPGRGHGLAGAQRLMKGLEIVSGPAGTTVILRKPLPPGAPLQTARALKAVADELLSHPAGGPMEEVQVQNQELLHAIEEVRSRQEELGHLNQELAATNTGVLALYDELDTLHRVSVLVASKLDLKSLLQSIIDATTELTDADFGAFYYREEAAETWSLHATSGPKRDLLAKVPPPEGADFFSPDFACKGVLRVSDLRRHADPCFALKFAAALQDFCQIRSCLTVPVVTLHNELLGALVLGSEALDFFSERSERIVASIAAQAVIGIEKARLFHAVTAVSEAKDRFLAMVSHELRTPLNPVMAIISSMRSDARLPEDVREDLSVVWRNVQLETRLIDDLLDFNRIIKGKIQLQLEEVDVHAMIRSVVQICGDELAEKGHQLQVDLRASRAVVMGDSARLQQVLWNVLKNAIKFTPQGGRISIRTGVDAEERLRIITTDSGRGIEAAALQKIFAAFEQSQVPAEFGGLGLGLAISRTFVDLHGGQISAASEGSHRGARITVLLPLLSARTSSPLQEQAAPSAAAPPSAGHAGPSILLVDDHVDTLNSLSRLLTRRGYQITAAATCSKAKQLTKEHDFQLIVSDLGLPDCSGLELITEVRKTLTTPAIALSGFGMEADIAGSKAAGFNEHLTKPIDFALLERTIERLLGGHNGAPTKR